MTNYPTRPTADFHQPAGASSKTAEIVVLSMLHQLVRKKVLSAKDALDTFSNLQLLSQGINNSHEIGLTISFWRRTFEWMLEQEPTPSHQSDRAA